MTARMKPIAAQPALDALLKEARAKLEKMTPEEREAMWKAQRESWTRQDMD